MSRGSSQSWWGRAARLGPATQRGRAGGHLGHRGPQLRAPLTEAGRQLLALALWGHRPRSKVLLSWGLCPPRGWGVGWGGVSALSWGRGAPSRAGERAGSRVRLRSTPPL